MPVRRPIRLPKQWPAHVKSGVLHAISLTSVVLSFARSRATGRRRLQAEIEQANTEIALLREELCIKDARNSVRPAAGTWKKTARVFLVDLQTLLIRMRRLDEQGERALIQTVDPVNRYPDFVRNLVRQTM